MSDFSKPQQNSISLSGLSFDALVGFVEKQVKDEKFSQASQPFGLRLSVDGRVNLVHPLMSEFMPDIRFIRKHFRFVLERTLRELWDKSCLELEDFAA